MAGARWSFGSVEERSFAERKATLRKAFVVDRELCEHCYYEDLTWSARAPAVTRNVAVQELLVRSIPGFDPVKAGASLFHRSRFELKATRSRRFAGLDVFQLEDRTLLSGAKAIAVAQRPVVAATAAVVESRSAVHRVPESLQSKPAHVVSVRHPGRTMAHAPAVRKVKAPTPLQYISPLERLAYYDPGSGHFIQLTTSNLKNLKVKGKDVYVLVHGWAPGYAAWVQNYADANNGAVLKWWQTIPENYSNNADYQKIAKLDTQKVGPESPWLLEGYPSPVESGDTVVSANGMAQDLIASDPNPKNALVLAYSWLDEAATPNRPTIISGLAIPEDGNKAGAKTTLNGQRLAVALKQVLGSQKQFNGKLQLIGHSFGSKVATVAAVALENAASPIAVDQLTLLDSPESDTYFGSYLSEYGLTNDNWYFLQNLNIKQNPISGEASTVVDNYISAFDEPYDVVSYTKSNVKSNTDLNQVIDSVFYPALNTNAHSYAAEWYAGSSEGKATTNGYQAGRLWSPLMGNQRIIPPVNYHSGITSYNQQLKLWYSSIQYYLDTPILPAVLPNTPTFTTVDLSPASPATPPGVSVTDHPDKIPGDGTGTGATVTLTQNKSKTVSYTGNFVASGRYLSGISFDYQFTNWKKGDRLNIYVVTVDGNHKEISESLRFTMNPWLSPTQPDTGAQSKTAIGTLSLSNATLSVAPYVQYLKFELTSTKWDPKSKSSVTVSNLMQFADGLIT